MLLLSFFMAFRGGNDINETNDEKRTMITNDSRNETMWGISVLM